MEKRTLKKKTKKAIQFQSIKEGSVMDFYVLYDNGELWKRETRFKETGNGSMVFEGGLRVEVNWVQVSIPQ